MSAPARRDDAQAHLRYLSHAEQLEEGRPPGLARASVLAVVLLLAGAGVWSARTEVARTVPSTGQVIPAGPLQIVQHLEGGIVAEVLASDGDIVGAGQPLLRLSAAAAASELEQLRSRESGFALRVERLRAFAERRPLETPAVLPEHVPLLVDQRAILRSQEESREAQRAVLRRQLAEREADGLSLPVQIDHARQQVGLLEEEVQMRRTLLERGLSSRVVYLDAERRYAAAQGELAQLAGALARNREQVGELGQRLAELDARLAQDALNEMGQVAAELAQVRDTIRKHEDRIERLTVRAPLRGVVKDMPVKTVGGVIQPGGPVAEIVPLGEELVVQARIGARDIANIQPGDPAFVKVTAFDFARFGGIEGTVRQISPMTFEDAEKRPYYRATVALSRNHVGDDPAKNLVLPGMTVQADIVTGHRTVLQYIAQPIHTWLGAAFRER